LVDKWGITSVTLKRERNCDELVGKKREEKQNDHKTR
jgi:hypothetical protein